MARKRVIVALALVVFLTGCLSSSGVYPSQTTTQVDLSKANYRVIKAGAQGTSHGFKLLGIIAITAPSYARAMRELRTEAPMEGKAAALANVTQDISSLYVILFSISTVTVSGDIIEFTDQPSQSSQPPQSSGGN